MSAFDKLVRSKRSKMLCLSVLLSVAVLVRQTSSINLTYFVRKDAQKSVPTCVAEENERYSAIGWIYPLPTNKEDEPKITTSFLPKIENDYNCHFSKGDKCNKLWALKNWQIDDNSTLTLEPLFDTRWEDFPIIYTSSETKEFEERVEIPNPFRSGFSLRASESVEVLLCTGWNPYNYPCYHLNVTTTSILLRKFAKLPKDSLDESPILDSYQAFANILTEDEWRNFEISLNEKGVLTLIDWSANRTVISYEEKEEEIKPLYLLVRSQRPALWKIHQNHFFYTKSPQTSRLGPILSLPSKEMCVSLYISTCPTCAISFFAVRSNEKKFLNEINPTGFKWQRITLEDDHIKAEQLNIFVETRFTKVTNQSEGFWAIDDVRVCQENEVKVTYLKLKNASEKLDDGISCQIVQHPKWRPKKLTFPEVQDFPTIDHSSNSTSIFLNWTQEDPKSQINYFITYRANDLCPEESPNLDRIKSNGFLMTKHNEITISNLVPYTTYNITFSSMLHEKENETSVMTQETEKPTLEELPSKLNVTVTDTLAVASWSKIDCHFLYGPVLYQIKTTNMKTNVSKNIYIQSENSVLINDLDPFTLYTLHVVTARSFENLQNEKNVIEMTSDFTTQPGQAPPVENLELYSVDTNSVSFRYNLPKTSKGVPVYAQVTRCNAITFKKCKSASFPIKPCILFPKKYCVDLNNLIPMQKYTFKFSVRNDGTQLYGESVEMEAFMDERVPGAPTNLTYKMVDCKDALDYCHLNVSWRHPYDQNGTITSFNIVLNSTDGNIQEVLKVLNSTYYTPKYDYQIKFIPYSTRYDLYIQSANSRYKSTYTYISLKTDDVGDHIDQNPTVLRTNPSTVTFRLPHLDHRLNSYTLTTIVQDFNKEVVVPPAISRDKKLAQHLCHNFGHTWLLEDVRVDSNQTDRIDIGTGDKSNRYLQPETQYCLTFIVRNEYRKSEHQVVYYRKLETPKVIVEEGGFNPWYLLLLLLLVPVGFLTYRYFQNRRPRKSKESSNKENEYESLPFDECEINNCVNNDTYDHLMHK